MESDVHRALDRGYRWPHHNGFRRKSSRRGWSRAPKRRKRVPVWDGVAVEFDNNVTTDRNAFATSFDRVSAALEDVRRWTVVVDVRHENAVHLGEVVRIGHEWIDRNRTDTHERVTIRARFDERRNHAIRKRRRDGESDVVAATRTDDANDVSIEIDQWAPLLPGFNAASV